MKKVIVFLLSALIIIAALSGCTGSKNSESAKENKTATQTEETKSNENETASTTELTTSKEKTTVNISLDKDKKISGQLSDFNAETIDGKDFSKSDFAKYDVTIIYIWGTQCNPCIEDMPYLAEYKNTLSENVNFITYCVDGYSNKDEAKEILKKANMDATALVNADGDFYAILNQIQYIPTAIFVDKDGKLIGNEIVGGVEDIEKTYNEHLKAALEELKK